jgi:hypothetical protein
MVIREGFEGIYLVYFKVLCCYFLAELKKTTKFLRLACIPAQTAARVTEF